MLQPALFPAAGHPFGHRGPLLWDHPGAVQYGGPGALGRFFDAGRFVPAGAQRTHAAGKPEDRGLPLFV